MKCGEITKLLSSYQDDELDPDLKGVVEEHLNHCRHCRNELQMLESVILRLKAVEEVIPAPQFNARVMAGIKEKSQFRYTITQTGSTFMNLALEYEPVMGRLGHFLFGGVIQKKINRTGENLKHFYEN